MQGLKEMGAFGLQVPPEMGGLGLSNTQVRVGSPRDPLQSLPEEPLQPSLGPLSAHGDPLQVSSRPRGHSVSLGSLISRP